MSRRALLILVLYTSGLMRVAVIAAAAAGAPSATVPASAPASAPVANEPLAGGALRYAPPPPPDWQLISKSEDGLKAAYQIPGRARIDVSVTVQDQAMPPDQKQRMAVIIGKSIRESAKEKGAEILLPPRVENDDRFFLKVHDRQRRAESGAIADRLQIYRSFGVYFVHVAVTAFVDAPEQAAPMLNAAEDLLATMRATQGVKPIVFPRSRLRITPPVDWTVRKPDQPNGQAAAFLDPRDERRQILIRTRVIPKDAREDAGKRALLLDKMTDDERRQPPLVARGQNAAHAEQQEPAEKFLRKIRTVAQRDKDTLRVETRYLVVGDMLVSVRSVTPEGDEEVPRLADALAMGIKPLDELK
jgi:hypothetical protein